MTLKVSISDLTVTWPKDAPLAGRMQIVNPETDEVLYEGEPRLVRDGETLTISWTRTSEPA